MMAVWLETGGGSHRSHKWSRGEAKQVVLGLPTKVLGRKGPLTHPPYGGSPLPQGERAVRWQRFLPSPLAGEGGREATG